MRAEVEYKTIDSREDYEAHKEDILFLSHFLPQSPSPSQIEAFVLSRVGAAALIKINGVAAGVFSIDLFKKSAELHGVFRPNLSEFVSRPGAIKNRIVATILEYIFEDEKKRVLIMKCKPDNRGVRGLGIMWGAEKLKHLDKGRVVYKLTREKYREMKAKKGL